MLNERLTQFKSVSHSRQLLLCFDLETYLIKLAGDSWARQDFISSERLFSSTHTLGYPMPLPKAMDFVHKATDSYGAYSGPCVYKITSRSLLPCKLKQA